MSHTPHRIYDYSWNLYLKRKPLFRMKKKMQAYRAPDAHILVVDDRTWKIPPGGIFRPKRSSDLCVLKRAVRPDLFYKFRLLALFKKICAITGHTHYLFRRLERPRSNVFRGLSVDRTEDQMVVTVFYYSIRIITVHGIKLRQALDYQADRYLTGPDDRYCLGKIFDLGR